jgi:hypothetical protein
MRKPYMRTLALRLLALAGVVLTFEACADSPTSPPAADPTDEAPFADCYWRSDGTAVCDSESPDWECDPWEALDWCDDGGGECMTSVGDPTDPEEAVTVQGCPGGGGGSGGGGYTPPPGGDDPGTMQPDSTACEQDCPGEEIEDSDICPEPLGGRTLTYLATIGGRSHEFKFRGTMHRVNPLVGRSPAWYRISGPHVSSDSWWIAESGDIQLVCWGRWHLRNSVWLGTVVVQADDLHVVMGPGHPDFENQPPYPPTYVTDF